MSDIHKDDTREIIRLYYRNEFGDEFEISEHRHMQPDFGDTTIAAFAKTINTFLRHIGYLCYDKDCVFLESITKNEYEQLEDYLYGQLRNTDSGGNDD